MTTIRTHSVRAVGMDVTKPSLLRRATKPALVLATTLALGGAVAASPAAAAGPNSCDASALQLSLLGGAPIDPIHANPPFTPCVNADGTLVNLNLPLGLGHVDAVEANTRVTPHDQAVSYAKIAGLKVGVNGITGQLTGILLGGGTDSILGPITNTVNGLLGSNPLLSSLTGLLGLDLLSGNDLLGSLTGSLPGLLNNALPDVLAADVIAAGATAKCVNGNAQLTGASQIAGLRVLGTGIDANGAANRILSIDTAHLNLGQLLSVDDILKNIKIESSGPLAAVLPLLLGSGTTLYDVLHSSDGLVKVIVNTALLLTPYTFDTLLTTITNTLQPILNSIQVDLPPGLLRAQVTPNAQTVAGGVLTQSALWLNVTALGQPILGGALAQARVGAGSPGCVPPKTPGDDGKKGDDDGKKFIKNPDKFSSPEAEAILMCAKNPLTLIDVVPSGSRALITGVAAKRFVGKTATIYQQYGKKKVGTTKVRADGTFTKRVAKPPKKIRSTNKARYYAVISGKKTKALKYERRMQNRSISEKNGTVTMKGQVVSPRFKKQPTVLVRYRKSCKRYTTVKRIKPNSKGQFTAKFKAPKGVGAAVYRAQTFVPSSARGTAKHPTYTLPRVVGLYEH